MRLHAEEREARLQYYNSDRHRELQVVQSHLPLFDHRSVRTKMLKFYAHMTHGLTEFTAVCHLLGEVPWPPALLNIY